MQQQHWTTSSAIVVPPRRSDVCERNVDGEALLYDPCNGNLCRLNETALVVWRACDGQASAHDIARQLVDSFEVEFDTALDHVDQLVAMFAKTDLLEG